MNAKPWDLLDQSLRVSDDIANMRMSICHDCKHLTVTKQCTKCGCFMELKTKLKNAYCPIYKWVEIENEGEQK